MPTATFGHGQPGVRDPGGDPEVDHPRAVLDVTSTLDGFRSRWTSPAAWIDCSASAIPAISQRTASDRQRPALVDQVLQRGRRHVRGGQPRHRGRPRRRRRPPRCRNRRPSGPPRSRGRSAPGTARPRRSSPRTVLIATRRPEVERARYTSPIPPAPSRPSTSKGPIRLGSCAVSWSTSAATSPSGHAHPGRTLILHGGPSCCDVSSGRTSATTPQQSAQRDAAVRSPRPPLRPAPRPSSHCSSHPSSHPLEPDSAASGRPSSRLAAKCNGMPSQAVVPDLDWGRTITCRRVVRGAVMTSDSALALRELLTELLGVEPPFRLRTWDNAEAGPPDGPLLTVANRRALRHLFWAPNELGLARAYVAGDLTMAEDGTGGPGRPEDDGRSSSCCVGSPSAEPPELSLRPSTRTWSVRRDVGCSAPPAPGCDRSASADAAGGGPRRRVRSGAHAAPRPGRDQPPLRRRQRLLPAGPRAARWSTPAPTGRRRASTPGGRAGRQARPDLPQARSAARAAAAGRRLRLGLAGAARGRSTTASAASASPSPRSRRAALGSGSPRPG